jgi:drug/metabolite transporter (DMT)-like permease
VEITTVRTAASIGFGVAGVLFIVAGISMDIPVGLGIMAVVCGSISIAMSMSIAQSQRT